MNQCQYGFSLLELLITQILIVLLVSLSFTTNGKLTHSLIDKERVLHAHFLAWDLFTRLQLTASDWQALNDDFTQPLNDHKTRNDVVEFGEDVRDWQALNRQRMPSLIWRLYRKGTQWMLHVSDPLMTQPQESRVVLHRALNVHE